MNIQPTTAESAPHGALQPNEMEALKKSFAEDGYFVVRNVVSPERLADLHKNICDAFEQAKQTGTLFSGGGLVSGHLNCFPGEASRFVYETLEQRGIIDAIKQVHPKAVRMPNVGCNFNLPGSVTQHFHADREFTREFVIANIAVVDTVIANGAIDMVPGTHKKFYPYWKFALEGLARKGLRVEMKQGDIMVRTSNVWHRGMPNRTAAPRPMMALTWEDGGSLQEDPFAAGGGKIAFRPNWFKPTRLGRIRERVFVSVPASYSAYRIVSSLMGKGY